MVDVGRIRYIAEVNLGLDVCQNLALRFHLPDGDYALAYFQPPVGNAPKARLGTGALPGRTAHALLVLRDRGCAGGIRRHIVSGGALLSHSPAKTQFLAHPDSQHLRNDRPGRLVCPCFACKSSNVAMDHASAAGNLAGHMVGYAPAVGIRACRVGRARPDRLRGSHCVRAVR